MEREKDIETRVKKGIEDAGGLFFKFTSPGNDGVPDRIAVLPGRTVYVELKTKTGRLSKLQRYQIDRLLKAAGLCRERDGGGGVLYLRHEGRPAELDRLRPEWMERPGSGRR